MIGGLDRWRRRLDGLEAELARAAAALEADAARREHREQRIARLRALRAFALPLLERLAALPRSAPWSAWLPELAALAEAGLREPGRVIGVLDELRPLGPVGPVGLQEVRHVLEPHLLELPSPPPARRYGRVFVGPIHAARGLDFDLVFVAGLGERIFPIKLLEDPLLLDADRRDLPLDTDDERCEDERLLLHLAVGATSGRVVLSWPRIELDQVRARVPSVYVLDVVRAVEGHVPSFRDLSVRAERAGASRIDWPAPARPEDAVDAAEYDLAFLREVLDRPADQTRGAARWLVDASPSLYRSLKARWTRWHPALWPWDGLYAPGRAEVTDALAAHHPADAMVVRYMGVVDIDGESHRAIFSAVECAGRRLDRVLALRPEAGQPHFAWRVVHNDRGPVPPEGCWIGVAPKHGEIELFGFAPDATPIES